MGSVSSISGLQGAVSNKAVLNEAILDLSTVGLSAALSGMFGVDEEAFKVHPESASASPEIAVINGFLRRALVTALVEQNIRISERMQSGLVPFSVSACSSFNQDVLWGLPHKFAFLMVAARVRESAGSLVYLVPPFQRSALIYAANLPAEDPRVEAVRCDTLRAVKTLGIPMQDAEDFSDDDDGGFEPEQGVLVRTAREVLASLQDSAPPTVFSCSANSLEGRRALEATAVLEFPFTQAGQNSVEELGARLAYVQESQQADAMHRAAEAMFPLKVGYPPALMHTYNEQMRVCRGLHVLAAGKNIEPGARLVLVEQLHQLAATAATQWFTTDLGHVAGAAFASAVHNASDQSFMAAFAPQVEAAQAAHRADEAQREARRKTGNSGWGSWSAAPARGGWAPSAGQYPGRAEARARGRAAKAGKAGPASPVTAPTSVYCYTCFQLGHKSNACPNSAPRAALAAPSWENWQSSAPGVTAPAMPALEWHQDWQQPEVDPNARPVGQEWYDSRKGAGKSGGKSTGGKHGGYGGYGKGRGPSSGVKGGGKSWGGSKGGRGSEPAWPYWDS